ncbi:hypothetical protein TNCV_2993521 [Trichonephila clavipes]|nr:hypothetical protein TNCV_2993521 [Trichonephila clavipes]
MTPWHCKADGGSSRERERERKQMFSFSVSFEEYMFGNGKVSFWEGGKECLVKSSTVAVTAVQKIRSWS